MESCAGVGGWGGVQALVRLGALPENKAMVRVDESPLPLPATPSPFRPLQTSLHYNWKHYIHSDNSIREMERNPGRMQAHQSYGDPWWPPARQPGPGCRWTARNCAGGPLRSVGTLWPTPSPWARRLPALGPAEFPALLGVVFAGLPTLSPLCELLDCVLTYVSTPLWTRSKERGEFFKANASNIITESCRQTEDEHACLGSLFGCPTAVPFPHFWSLSTLIALYYTPLLNSSMTLLMRCGDH